ncbi:MAG: lipoyl(octanoyl) transferase LipB [Saprospiraceae bacterium]|nr:lipoyl(octanoyl) transferase LipB [Saprospiraceae bacterium]
MEQVKFRDLGLIDYQAAWDYQTELHKQVVNRKLENRQRRKDGQPTLSLLHHLLFCEHPPVYTLGKSGSLDHLLLKEEELADEGFTFYKINRGGDITYHGPGQIVGYPILDLDGFFNDVHKYVRYLEEAVIRTLSDYEIEAGREEGYTGVWLPQTDAQPKRKICAIGVHLSRWVTMHGFAFNVNTQLQHFDNIIPCGIQEEDKAVTSLAKELGHTVDIGMVKEKLKQHFAQLFGFGFE